MPFEEIEKSIIKLSEVGEKIEKSRLNRRTIILLLNDITKVPKSHIEYILNALPELKNKYLKKK